MEEHQSFSFKCLTWLEHEPTLEFEVILSLYPDLFVGDAASGWRQIVGWVLLDQFDWLISDIEHGLLTQPYMNKQEEE